MIVKATTLINSVSTRQQRELLAAHIADLPASEKLVLRGVVATLDGLLDDVNHQLLDTPPPVLDGLFA